MAELYDLPELYDAQYRHYRDDLAFYRRLAEDYGGPVLELGAGSGRVSAALAQAGHQVLAVERSPAMLAAARERLGAKGLLERVRLVEADMRALELPGRYPLVIAPFNALMHAYTLAEQDAVLAGAAQHLDEGGAFALDLYNPNFAALERLKLEAEWEHVGGEAGELFVYQRLDEDAQLLESRYYLDTTSADGSLRRQTATLRQRYYTRFELERALAQAGFAQRLVYGGFDRRRYRRSAPQLVVIARR